MVGNVVGNILGKRALGKKRPGNVLYKSNIRLSTMEKNSWNRIQQQKNLSMFGDKDRDGVPNILDCYPRNKYEQGFFHKLANFVTGQGWRENLSQDPTIRQRQLKNIEQDAYEKESRRLQLENERRLQLEHQRRLQLEHERRPVVYSRPIYTTPQVQQPFPQFYQPQVQQPPQFYQPQVQQPQGVRQMSQLTGGEGLRTMSQLSTKDFGANVTKLVGSKRSYGSNSNNKNDIRMAGIWDIINTISGKDNSKFTKEDALKEAQRRGL